MNYAEKNISNKQTKEISFVTWVGTIVNIILAAVKGAFGYLANSKVLIADAIHSLSDLVTDIAILVGVKYWSAPPDSEHPYGHGKIETLITFLIGAALAFVGITMGCGAISTFFNIVILDKAPPTITIDTMMFLALAAAVFSIISKEILYRWTVKKGIKIGSSAVIANAWHHRSDALSSIPPAVAIGGVIIGSDMGYDFWFLDPVGTLIVCYMLLHAAWDIAGPSLYALIDTSANRRVSTSIFIETRKIPEVVTTHKIRTNYIGMDAIKVDLHVLVNRDLSVLKGHLIADEVEKNLINMKIENDKTRILDVVVHIEPATEKEYNSYINNKGK